MSVRGLLIGAILLCVLAGVVYWSERKQVDEAGKSESDAKKIVSIKEDDVKRVQIQRMGEPAVVLERDGSNQWQIAAPVQLKADADAASGIVQTFVGLTRDKVVDEKASNLAQFGLATPVVEVSVLTKDGKTSKLLIGDETPTAGGNFAKVDSKPEVFTVASYAKTGLDKSVNDLRDKRLLTFNDAKLSRVEVQAKGLPVEFGKNAQGEWQIVKPRPMRADNLQVEELVRKLKDARMEVSSGEDEKVNASKFASAVRLGNVSLTDAAGTQTLEVRKSGEDYFAKSSVVAGVHKLGKDAGDALSKGIEDYRNKKLFDFGWSDPSKIEIRDGGTFHGFTKGGESWWSNGKQVDATSVQSLIDKLRELAATKFLESGFTTPELEITVTSQEGKRVEKVAIAKSGNTFLGKRENEPTIYELDATRVEEIRRAAADVKPPPPPAKK